MAAVSHAMVSAREVCRRLVIGLARMLHSCVPGGAEPGLLPGQAAQLGGKPLSPSDRDLAAVGVAPLL